MVASNYLNMVTHFISFLKSSLLPNIMQASDKRFNNRGAYIVLQPPHFASPVFHSFEAVKPRPQVIRISCFSCDYGGIIDAIFFLPVASLPLFFLILIISI